MNPIVLSGLVMGGIAGSLGIMLAIADIFFYVEEDPRLLKVVGALPGVNCGACGHPGCNAYAQAIIGGKAEPNLCIPGGVKATEFIATILGVSSEAKAKRKAVVHCQGGTLEAPKKIIYEGVTTCSAIQSLGGDKSCAYGCLGCGDCTKVCLFDAMEMGTNGLPIINVAKCTGCGKCVSACPRKIIALHELEQKTFVLCCSLDPAKIVNKVCSVGCNACKLCEKKMQSGAFLVVDNLCIPQNTGEGCTTEELEHCPKLVIKKYSLA